MIKNLEAGLRRNVGRPKLVEKRKQRALRFFNVEWASICEKAKEKNLSPRAYLYSLVEKDTCKAMPQ